MAAARPAWLAMAKAQIAAAPVKAAALGIFSLVLVVIVAVQLGGGPRPATTGAAAATLAVSPPQDSLEAVVELATAFRVLVDEDWPLPPELPEDVARNPFARPQMASSIIEAAPEPQDSQPEVEDGIVPIDPTEWLLEATFVSGEGSEEAFAVINGAVLRRRDRLGDFELADIGPRYVVIESPQRRLVLHMR